MSAVFYLFTGTQDAAALLDVMHSIPYHVLIYGTMLSNSSVCRWSCSRDIFSLQFLNRLFVLALTRRLLGNESPVPRKMVPRPVRQTTNRSVDSPTCIQSERPVDAHAILPAPGSSEQADLRRFYPTVPGLVSTHT